MADDVDFTREELVRIVYRAKEMARRYSSDSAWEHAYMELASDASYLASMLERAGTVIKTYITDGYQFWERECPECHKPTMEVVRIGKVQCSNCG